MLPSISRLSPAFALAAAAILSGTTTKLSAQLGTIESNAPGKDIVRMMQPSGDSLVMTPDGIYWTLVYERVSTSNPGYLELRYSDDQGVTWVDNDLRVQGGTVQHSSLASLCLGRDTRFLHIVFSARTGGGGQYYSAYHQMFDARARTFVGQPDLIADGTTSTAQFYGHSIAETGEGTVVAAITSHRSGGLGLGSWSCGLWAKPRGGAWPANGVQVNSSSGQSPSMDVEGETVHMVMRDTTGGYGTIYRRYNLATSAFETPVVPIWPASQNNVVGAGNINALAIDSKGGRYVLWVEGVVSNNTNAALNLSYAAPGTGDAQADWSKNELFKDSAIRGGNSSERFYGVARTPGGSIYVFYSKPSENYDTLYYEIWADGRAVLPFPLEVQRTTTAGRFEWVSGVRQSRFGSHPLALTWGLRTAGSSSGQVDVWRIGDRGYYTVYGSGCRANLPAAPKASMPTPPTPGVSNTLDWTGLPVSAPCFISFGLAATPSISLGFLGAPLCSLDHDRLLLTNAAATSGTGTFQFQAVVPNLPNLPGVGIHFQILAAATGAPGGVVTTEAVAWRF